MLKDILQFLQVYKDTSNNKATRLYALHKSLELVSAYAKELNTVPSSEGKLLYAGFHGIELMLINAVHTGELISVDNAIGFIRILVDES
jgi:hypothetical protein